MASKYTTVVRAESTGVDKANNKKYSFFVF